MSAQATLPAHSERRRSVRVPIRLVLIICGDDGRLQEQTHTFSLNAHGVLVPLTATVTIGQRLVIQNPENWAERNGHVASIGRCYAGRTEVGIEFSEPSPDFWLIDTSSAHVHEERPGVSVLATGETTRR
jgi:hypothetical protein